MVGTLKQSVRWALSHGLPSVVMKRAAARGDIQGRLVSQGRGMDGAGVAAIAAEVRADGVLHRSRFAHITASLPTVKEVLTSNDFRTGVFDPGDGVLGRLGRWAEEPGRLGPLTPPSLLVTEPPDHTRYRKLVTRVFTARAVEGLRARTQEIADELLDRLDPSDPVELVSTYCSRLPVTVIAEILGVPERDHQRVLEFGTAAAPSLDLGLSWAEFRHVEKGLGEFQTWLAAHLTHLRDHPGDDLHEPARAGPRRGAGAERRGADGDRRARARRRLRDHGEPARQRDRAAGGPPRAAGAAARGAVAVDERGRRGAPARPAGAADRPPLRG